MLLDTIAKATAYAIGGVRASALAAAVRLHVDDLHLKREDGSTYQGLHHTDFRSYERWLKGERDDLERVYDYYDANGFTGSRVFAFHMPSRDGVVYDPFNPKDYGAKYYDQIIPYFEFRASRGHYVHWVTFLGAVPGIDPFTTIPEQDEHFLLTNQALRQCPNVCPQEILNEGVSRNPDLDPFRFTPDQFAGVLTARTRFDAGISLEDWLKPCDLLLMHDERRDRFNTARCLRAGEAVQQGDPGFGLPSRRKPLDHGEPGQAKRDMLARNPGLGIFVNQYRQAVPLGLFCGNIVTVHGPYEEMQKSLLPQDPEVRECIEQAGQVFRSGIIPTNAPDWRYRRDESVESIAFRQRFPDDSGDEKLWDQKQTDERGVKHLYGFISPDGKQEAVCLIEPGGEFRAEDNAKPGWRIVKSDPAIVISEVA